MGNLIRQFGDLKLHGMIDDLSSLRAKNWQSTNCEFEVTQSSGHRICHYQGEFAARVLHLFDALEQGAIKHYAFNCHGAVSFLLGQVETPTKYGNDPDEQGRRMFVRDAVRELDGPFVFQITNHWEKWSSKSRTPENVFSPVHSGLVLGSDATGEPVTMEKDCDRAYWLRYWRDTEYTYFHGMNYKASHVTCFAKEELLPSPVSAMTLDTSDCDK